MTSTKVFVGNLSFKTNSDKLTSEFQVAGTVLNANIISRGPRSLGYGFVELATPEDAVKAVELLNQKEIDGRAVNVEVAKPRVEKPVVEHPQGGQGQQEGDDYEERPRRKRRTRPQRSNNTGGFQQQQSQQSVGQQQQQPQQPRGFRRQYRPRQNAQGFEGANGQPDNYNNTGYRTNYNNNQGGFRFNKYRNKTNTNTAENTTTTGNRPRQQQQQHQQQQPQQQQQGFQRRAPQPRPVTQRRPQNRVPSKTTLFVANLPFAVTDTELAEIFSQKLKVASAHVVKKRNDRSKGFGFVEFETEADQQTALKEFEGFTVHERPINVKVALTVVPEAGQTTEGAATTTTSTTAAATTTTADSSKPVVEETKAVVAEEAKPVVETKQPVAETPAAEEKKAQ